MKNIISQYKYSLIGLVISIIGYFISLSLNIDVSDKIDTYIGHLENFEIDELFAIWLKVFILFAIINFVVMNEKRKNTEKRKIYGSMLVIIF